MSVPHGLLDPSSSSTTSPDPSLIPSDPPTAVSGNHTLLQDTPHPASHSPSQKFPPSTETPVHPGPSDMIAVQHSPILERGSYFDHDDDEDSELDPDDTIHPSAAARLSATVSQLINPFRLFSSTSDPPPASPPAQSSSQSPPDSPPSIDQSFPHKSSFDFPLVSPPTSPLLAGPSSRRSRPSMEGLFDLTPRTTREIKNLPSNASSKNSATNPKRLSNTTSSSNSSQPSSKRRLPAGENPLIFGPVSPRRISKSVPLNPGPSIDAVSSAIRAPALSVTSPTPQPSPSRPHSSQGLLNGTAYQQTPEAATRIGSLRKPGSGTSPPKTVTYEDEVRHSGSGRSKGKRKSEELDSTAAAAAACDEEGRLEKDRSRRGSEHLSNTSSTAASSPPPPSAFSSATRRNSKRIKLTPATPDGTAAPPSPSSARDPSLRPSRPESKASRRPMSFVGGSQGSLPLSAIISPRPPSVIQSDYYGRRAEGFYMRDPRREWETMNVSWSLKGSQEQHGTPPRSALLFYLGFIMPLLWFVGALLRNTSPSHDLEQGGEVTEVKKWDQQAWQTSQIRNKVYKTWRDRNRFMALLSVVTYLPIIVCLAIFVPR